MNILDALKRKHEIQIRQKQQLIGRKQVNTAVSTTIIEKLKRLAAEFAVPRYAITEHLLETGNFYIFKVLENPKKKELLREHLIDRHMLDNGYDDPEELLRIGEGRYASELILLAKDVRRDLRVLGRVLPDAKRTGNLNVAEKAQDKLLRSAIILADWLSKHSLDETSEDQVENS